jgi:MFS family permease
MKSAAIDLKDATASKTEALSHPSSPWPIFWVASVAVFLVSMDSTMLFAAFHALRAGFPSASAADMSWVINAYTVVYAAILIPAGGLADRHGRKKVFMLGAATFLIASGACGLAPTVAWLIAARVLQAVGAALLTPASLSIVLAAFPQSKRAVAVSLWGAVGALAAAVGPSLGSFVVDSVGWPWAFYINLPLGAFSMWRGRKLLIEARKPDTQTRLDLVGMLLLIVGVGAIALSIVQSDSPLWQRSTLQGVAGCGVLALICFVLCAVGTRGQSPAGGFEFVSAPNLLLRESGHAVVWHGVFDDVLRLLLLHDANLALQPHASRSSHHTRPLAGDAGGDCDGPLCRASGAPPFSGWRQHHLRRQRSMVFAGARHRASVCQPMVAGATAQRHSGRTSVAIVVGCRGQ